MEQQSLNILVDLTPVLPGGHNGGAKITSLQLIKNMATCAPHYQFLLLATAQNFEELSQLASSNIKIIYSPSAAPSSQKSDTVNIKTKLINLTKKIVFRIARGRLRYYLNQIRTYFYAKKITSEITADLIFYPFTAPFNYGLKLPIVSTVYDLQAFHYPFFFSDEDRFNRQKHVRNAFEKADRLICISDYVRGTILEESKLPPEKVKTVHINFAQRLSEINPSTLSDILKQYDLTEHNYLLYPANFWLHKNHTLLFTAFSMYRHKHPESKLKLVCTGADSEKKSQLLSDIKQLQLSDWILMPGYLSDEELAGLLQKSKALIYPSIYEGFGMPIVEAMALGVPVLCSNVTSLPEVAGSAAIYFDPRKPAEIANAIERIETEPKLIDELIKHGKDQSEKFKNEKFMAEQYLQVFREVVREKQSA